MDDINRYNNKRSYNNLPVPEGQYLAPFLVHSWDEVKAMNYHRENLETWHFNGIAVLVAFTPVTAEQFSVTIKLFWSDVRTYIAELKKNQNILSYDKMLESMMSEDGNGYDPAQTESLENSTLLGLIIDNLICQVREMNPHYGRILDLICEDYTKGQILDELGLGKSQGYADIKAAQALAKKLYFSE